VSDIVPSLLMNDDIYKAAGNAAQQPGSGCDDAEQAVKKARVTMPVSPTHVPVCSQTDAMRQRVCVLQVIWKYRSSLSEKRALLTGQRNTSEVEDATSKRMVNDTFLQLWELIAKPAQSISHAHLRRKFS
jgi:hypothetical protein